MQYQLILQRVKEYDSVTSNKGKTEPSTIGELTLVSATGVEVFKGYTCENIGPSTDASGTDKRIVAREYQLSWTPTSQNSNNSLGDYKNNAILLSMKDNPKFAQRRILIHVGNYPSDTLGCILVGTSTNKGYVSNSVKAIIKLYDIIQKVGIDNVTLIVKEIE